MILVTFIFQYTNASNLEKAKILSCLMVNRWHVLNSLSWKHFLLTFPKRQISHSSKLKEFADDNFKWDENGRKFYNG